MTSLTLNRPAEPEIENKSVLALLDLLRSEADANGEVTIAILVLAERLEADYRRTRRAMARLVDKRLVLRLTGGHGRVRRYRVVPEEAPAPPAVVVTPDEHVRRVKPGTYPVPAGGFSMIRRSA